MSAERWLRLAARPPHPDHPVTLAAPHHDELRDLLAEYDRRGKVEALAGSVVKAEQDAARELETENEHLRAEVAHLRGELTQMTDDRDALFQAFERVRALGEEIQRQADTNTSAVAPTYLRGVEQARIAARIRRALGDETP